MSIDLRTADCLEEMPALAAESVDAIVCDPPYGLSFMGKDWDHGVPGESFWREALRVAKPGAHLLAFGGTRTHHRLMCAIEDAGWEIRDCVMWVYGSGFPKSLDVSKAIDKAAGVEREVVGEYAVTRDLTRHGRTGDEAISPVPVHGTTLSITAPATEAARQWSGWGTALKPAYEIIILARKPLIGTVAQNVQRYGTGAINVDGCRVGTTVETWPKSRSFRAGISSGYTEGIDKGDTQCTGNAPAGRWPSNLIHDGSEEVVRGFPQTTSGNLNKVNTGIWGNCGERGDIGHRGDSGSAARFFYCAKASKADRDEGLEGMEAVHRANGNKWTDQDYRVQRGERPPSAESGPRRNHHPTVKPTALMRYLCRLVTPPGGTVLDPFMGSGTTCVACIKTGRKFIGIEKEPKYFDIAVNRIEKAFADQALFAESAA